MSAHCKSALQTLERVRYFPRQLITADDMTLEQEYFRQKMRRHNRFLHGWGVVCGGLVEAAPDAEHPWQVRLCPSFIVAPQGDDIPVPEPVLYDLATGICDREPCQPWPCPPPTSTAGGTSSTGNGRQEAVYLAIRHAECDSRPVRVHPLGCGCDESLCEYSRIRDDFELKLLCELPKSHIQAAAADIEWAAKVKDWDHEGPLPVPLCPGCPDEPWVVLARIHLPPEGQPLKAGMIDYFGRRVLLSTNALQVMAMVL